MKFVVLVLFFIYTVCASSENYESISMTNAYFMAKVHPEHEDLLTMIQYHKNMSLAVGTKKGCDFECALALSYCVTSCYCAVPPCTCCWGCFKCLTPLYKKCCACIFPESYCSAQHQSVTGETGYHSTYALQ